MARTVGVLLIVLGVIGLALPFVGPTFGFGMGPDPAWVLTEARLVRHVVPGLAIIVGGLLLLPRSRPSHVLGGILAVVGGVWITVAPVVLGRVVADSPPALIDVLRPLAYHFGTGLVITALAAFVLGVVAGRRNAERSVIDVTDESRDRAHVTT
jgi:hypothetical protein